MNDIKHLIQRNKAEAIELATEINNTYHTRIYSMMMLKEEIDKLNPLSTTPYCYSNALKHFRQAEATDLSGSYIAYKISLLVSIIDNQQKEIDELNAALEYVSQIDSL